LAMCEYRLDIDVSTSVKVSLIDNRGECMLKWLTTTELSS